MRRGVFLGALALSSAACSTDKLLKVRDPAVATPQSLQTPAGLSTLYAGAIGDFAAAWNGNSLTDAFVPTVGIFTDEFRSSDTFTTRNDADRRAQSAPANGNLSDNSYIALHKARRAAQVGADFVKQFSTTIATTAGDARYAELQSLAGYTYLAFGEGFCGNVPIPPTDAAGTVYYTAGVGTQALFDTAIVRFKDAIAATAAKDTVANPAILAARNLARVGLGRALLNQGKFAAADSAVRGVPSTFVYKVAYSSNTTREQNSLWNLNSSNKRYTMADTEGTNGLNYRSANDPRIPWRRFFDGSTPPSSLGFDATNIVYEQRLYPSADADTPLADGVEARLIQAEANLQTGGTAWLDTLNAMRGRYATIQAARFENFVSESATDSVAATSLANLTDPGTPAARVDLLFRERAFWLYATGHRLGDLRRLIRQYGRTEDGVFPTGQWWKSGPYGDDVNLSIAFAEKNNTAFNPAACVTTTP
jgi:hypothetical protein